MKTGQEWIAEYSESHRNPMNKLLHWICVPAIMWAVLAFLWSIPVPDVLQFYPWVNWATLFVAIAQLFYLSFGLAIFIGMLLVSLVMLVFTAWLEQVAPFALWQIALVVFIVAWIGQFIGHHIEGKKPSFFKDLLFLLVGPAWEMNYFLRKIHVIS
ncbi:Mpo1 family 2-hydroxy fatty acid dioxygenase [Kangiella shandongensis]|uniref:Mpo1 family 2-hydroxy fatty acid dioxygenase n=1 Tax=Kangiella shandongensis TaxID=2763258 RepID=UPI001CC13A9B|nr:Mpo1-like protein [Kangiella shandongensis]